MTDPTPSPQPPCHAARWRAATLAGCLLLALGLTAGISMFEQFKAQVAHLQTQLKNTAQIRYIAVLLDAGQAPALLVTFDPREAALQVQRLNEVKEGREDSLQLWALPAGGPPRSLGVLGSASKTLQLPAREPSLAGVQRLAISVEGKGGAGDGSGPRLPYLFTGALVQKAM